MFQSGLYFEAVMYGWALLAVISDEGCLDHSERRRADIR